MILHMHRSASLRGLVVLVFAKLSSTLAWHIMRAGKKRKKQPEKCGCLLPISPLSQKDASFDFDEKMHAYYLLDKCRHSWSSAFKTCSAAARLRIHHRSPL